jgi:hypothetical protein
MDNLRVYRKHNFSGTRIYQQFYVVKCIVKKNSNIIYPPWQENFLNFYTWAIENGWTENKIVVTRLRDPKGPLDPTNVFFDKPQRNLSKEISTRKINMTKNEIIDIGNAQFLAYTESKRACTKLINYLRRRPIEYSESRRKSYQVTGWGFQFNLNRMNGVKKILKIE